MAGNASWCSLVSHISCFTNHNEFYIPDLALTVLKELIGRASRVTGRSVEAIAGRAGERQTKYAIQ